MSCNTGTRTILTACMYLYMACSLHAHSLPEDDGSGLSELARELLATDPDSALKVNKMAFEVAQRLNNDSLLLSVNANFGNIYYQTGNYYLAIDYFFNLNQTLQGIPYENLTTNRWYNLFAVKHKLADSYFQVQMHAFAQQYFHSALDLIELSENYKPGIFDDFDRVSVLFNLGAIYLAENDLDKAKESFDQVAELNASMNDSLVHMYLLNNYGIYYKGKGQHELSYENFKQALIMAIKAKDNYLLTKIYNNIGNYYLLRNDKVKSIENYSNAVDYGMNTTEWASVIVAANRLAELYAANGDYRNAYENSIMANQISDSLYSPDKAATHTRFALQYELDKGLRLEQMSQLYQVQRQHNMKLVWLMMSVGLMMVVVAGLFFIKNVQRKNRLLQLNQQNIDMQSREARREKEDINNRLEANQRHMTERAMAMVQKNEFIAKIAKELFFLSQDMDADNSHKLQRLIYEMKSERDELVWKEFEKRFVDVNSSFYKVLAAKFPKLTPAEKKLAAFLRLNMTSKDIAAITMQTPDSIKVARTRLRKKLGLDSSDNLIGFLESLEQTYKHI